MKWIHLCAVIGVLASASAAQERGPVTNLPLPRYVSLKATEANIRRGPSLTHRVDWIFQRRNMPLVVVAEHGHWRRVQDHDGAGGWVHYSLLSGVRTVEVMTDSTEILTAPREGAMVNAKLEHGVIARVVECEPAWCKLRAEGYEGWTPKSAIWGVGETEILE